MRKADEGRFRDFATTRLLPRDNGGGKAAEATTTRGVWSDRSNTGRRGS